MLLGTMHHCALHCVTKLHEVADHGHTVKQLRVMLQKLEPILLLQQLHATISRMDTRRNFQVVRNVAPCVRA